MIYVKDTLIIIIIIYLFIYLFFFYLLPVAPVGFKETLDGWPPPISSVG